MRTLWHSLMVGPPPLRRPCGTQGPTFGRGEFVQHIFCHWFLTDFGFHSFEFWHDFGLPFSTSGFILMFGGLLRDLGYPNHVNKYFNIIPSAYNKKRRIPDSQVFFIDFGIDLGSVLWNAARGRSTTAPGNFAKACWAVDEDLRKMLVDCICSLLILC